MKTETKKAAKGSKKEQAKVKDLSAKKDVKGGAERLKDRHGNVAGDPRLRVDEM